MLNLRTPGTYDMHARLRDFDRDGVAAAVIFHGSLNGEPFPMARALTSIGMSVALPSRT